MDAILSYQEMVVRGSVASDYMSLSRCGAMFIQQMAGKFQYN